MREKTSKYFIYVPQKSDKYLISNELHVVIIIFVNII